MKTSKSRSLGFAMIAVVFVAMPFHAAAESANLGPGRVAGSWDGTIDFFGQPFRALYSFLPAGVLLEADNPALDPNFGNLAFSPGHGTWKRVPGGSIVGTYQKLAYADTGALTLMARSTLRLERQPDGSLAGTLDLRLLTPDGILVDEFLGLGFTATRIEIDE